MKTVFRSAEIAHIWANSGAPHGRSPGNLSFDGDAISSYGTVIGRRIRHKGKVAYVLDRASFSVSTSKSQGRVSRAIPDSAKVFHVNCGSRGQSLSFTPATLAAHYEKAAAELGEELPSRYAFKRAEQYAGITAELQKARDVLAFFDMGTVRLDKKIAARKAGESEAAESLKAHREKTLAAKAAKERRELAERTRKNIKGAQEFLAGTNRPKGEVDLSYRQSALDLIPEPLRSQFVAAVEAHNSAVRAEEARKDAEKVEKWRAGADIEAPRDCPTMLRTESAEMVTSHGARVPLSDARRTYRFAMLCRAKGWHRNGETHAIGSYQLDAVNENGVVAGCHRVSWAEIERFALSQGWNTESEAAMNARNAGDRALSL